MGRSAYLVLTIVGAAVPLAGAVVFLADHGLDGDALVDPFGPTAALLVLLDLSISSVAFWVWMSRDAPRHGIVRWWPFVVANLLVGLSFGLPLYLYVRAGRPAPAAGEPAGAPAAAG